MAYAPHVLMTFGGPVGFGVDTGETWTCSLRLHLSNDLNPNIDAQTSMLDILLDYVVPKVQAFWQNNNLALHDSSKLSFVKLAAIKGDGKYARDAVMHSYGVEGISPGPTGGGGLKYPFQVSIVATFETGVGIGKARKGRFYLPTPDLTLGSDGLFLESECVTLAFAVAGFLASLEGAVAIDGGPDVAVQPAVISPLPASAPLGTVNPITRVSVDTRPDIQRSRARQLNPSRVSRPVQD
jgi:hypothetical protein